MLRLIAFALFVNVCAVGGTLGYVFWLQDTSARPSDPPAVKAAVEFDGSNFRVANTGSNPWVAAQFSINRRSFGDGFDLVAGTVGGGAAVKVGALQFAKSDGTRFNPLEVEAQTLTVTATIKGHTRAAIVDIVQDTAKKSETRDLTSKPRRRAR
jgi:hypothetical protein